MNSNQFFSIESVKLCFIISPGEKDGFVKVGPSEYLFPNVFAKHAQRLYNFQARPDDVWISTHPRSGTTLTQEMVWLIVNNFDYDRAQCEKLGKRSPFFE